jgi:hypothetical protein
MLVVAFAPMKTTAGQQEIPARPPAMGDTDGGEDLMEHNSRAWPIWWAVWIGVSLLLWASIFVAVTRAAWTESTIATSGFGLRGAPRLSASAVCRNAGHEAVWVAETGTEFLDIIQVGAMDGELFYAYGRGVPNGPGSLYVERHLGPSGTGAHRYGLSLAARVWTLTIDGRMVARIPDTFRTWRLRATQVMAEGNLPFGPARCDLPAGTWHAGGYGPQPVTSFGATWWSAR